MLLSGVLMIPYSGCSLMSLEGTQCALMTEVVVATVRHVVASQGPFSITSSMIC